MRCRQPTKIVHEIEPRSLRPTDWWAEDNQVPLCGKCHDWSHRVGTKNSAPILRQLRKQRLEEYGQSEDLLPTSVT